MRVGHKLEVTTGPEGTPRRQKVASFYTGNPTIALAMAWQNRPLWPAVASQVVGTLASLAEAVGQPWPDTPLARNGQPWPLNTFWTTGPDLFLMLFWSLGTTGPRTAKKFIKAFSGGVGWPAPGPGRGQRRSKAPNGTPTWAANGAMGTPLGFLCQTFWLRPFSWFLFGPKSLPFCSPLPTFGPPPATTPLFSQGSMS